MNERVSDSPNIKIVVAAHKPYWMPDDPMYVPVQVGAVGKESIPGFWRDDEGDNISAKNPRYCELTALYWAWKNLDADYIGLAHYRRYFAGSGERSVLTKSDAIGFLSKAPIVLPRKRHYVIETVGNHYAHTFDKAHLEITRQSLQEMAPADVSAFDEHLEARSAHIWNMFIMRRDILDQWCSWLFPILENIETRIDFKEMTPFEERVVGRVAERLLDPWLEMRGFCSSECSVTSMERTNWIEKGSSFLAAKFFGKKYEKSF